MPTVKFSDNPNEETAFVTQDGGQRNRAVLTAALDGTIKYPDNPNSTKVTVTVDGVERKAVAVVNIDGSGGGSDQHNLGWYATESALTTAHATATDGDWAIVGATDTVWVWDSDTTAWKDTGAAGIELPDQTGQSGKFLTTDGSSASWSDKPLVNKATSTQTNSYLIGNSLVPQSNGTSMISIGDGSKVQNESVAIGRNAEAYTTGVSIGCGAQSTQGVSVGRDAICSGVNSVLVGCCQSGANFAQSNSVLLGSLPPTIQQTSEPYNTKGFYWSEGEWDSTTSKYKMYKLFNQDGSLVLKRLADTTNAQQGDVLTLDANGDAVWQAGSGSLPSQTGNAGKFLTTDGTDASWSSALTNSTTRTGSVNILGNTSNYDYETILGQAAQASGNYSVSVGYNTRSTTGSIAIGSGANVSHNNAVAVGYNTSVTSNLSVAIGAAAIAHYNSVAVGYYSNASSSNTVAVGGGAQASANGAIQIGGGTNTASGTLQIGLYQGGSIGTEQYRLLNQDGTVPTERLTNAINKYSTMPTASADNLGWIVQFTGTTDSTYTHGHLYECVSDGADPATYSWEEVSMGGGGSSYTAGTGIDITNGTISVKPTVVVNNEPDYPQYNIAIADSAIATNNGVAIGFTASDNGGAAIGSNCTATNGFAGGVTCKSTGEGGVAIGRYCGVTADNAIQLGSFDQLTNNSDANTFKVGNANGNFEMMSADGTIPAARHASLPAADGTYVLKLVIASGVPTLSWVAE